MGISKVAYCHPLKGPRSSRSAKTFPAAAIGGGASLICILLLLVFNRTRVGLAVRRDRLRCAMSYYEEARKNVKAIKALTTLTSADAEKRRRFYASRKCNTLRTLVVVGKAVRPVVDAAAHAAVESGAGFTAYFGVSKEHVVRWLVPRASEPARRFAPVCALVRGYPARNTPHVSYPDQSRGISSRTPFKCRVPRCSLSASTCERCSTSCLPMMAPTSSRGRLSVALEPVLRSQTPT